MDNGTGRDAQSFVEELPDVPLEPKCRDVVGSGRPSCMRVQYESGILRWHVNLWFGQRNTSVANCLEDSSAVPAASLWRSREGEEKDATGSSLIMLKIESTEPEKVHHHFHQMKYI